MIESTFNMATEVFLHSKEDCPFCKEAKGFLVDRGIPYTEVKHDDEEERQAFYTGLGLTGQDRTVPQVMLTDAGMTYRIGGWVDLRRSGIESLFPKAP